MSKHAARAALAPPARREHRVDEVAGLERRRGGFGAHRDRLGFDRLHALAGTAARRATSARSTALRRRSALSRCRRGSYALGARGKHREQRRLTVAQRARRLAEVRRAPHPQRRTRPRRSTRG